MVSARHEGFTRSATSSAFTNGFLFRGTLWFAKNAWLLKCLLHSEQGILTAEKARGARHTIAIRSVTHVRNVSPTPFVTCFT